jgi:hypothetical protein
MRHILSLYVLYVGCRHHSQQQEDTLYDLSGEGAGLVRVSGDNPNETVEQEMSCLWRQRREGLEYDVKWVENFLL